MYVNLFSLVTNIVLLLLFLFGPVIGLLLSEKQCVCVHILPVAPNNLTISSQPKVSPDGKSNNRIMRPKNKQLIKTKIKPMNKTAQSSWPKQRRLSIAFNKILQTKISISAMNQSAAINAIVEIAKKLNIACCVKHNSFSNLDHRAKIAPSALYASKISASTVHNKILTNNINNNSKSLSKNTQDFGDQRIEIANYKFIDAMQYVCCSCNFRYKIANFCIILEPDTPYIKKYYVPIIGARDAQLKSYINHKNTNDNNNTLHWQFASDIWKDIEHSLLQIVNKTTGISINKSCCIVSVEATQSQHASIEGYLKQVTMLCSSISIDIEFNILEVQVNEKNVHGINWNDFSLPINASAKLMQDRKTMNVDINYKILLSALEKHGNIKTVSKTKISVLNNQSASLQIVKSQERGTFPFHDILKTNGITMLLHPIANLEDNSVMIMIKPTVSKIIIGSKNSQPIIVNETLDSVMRIRPNEYKIIGGLTKTSNHDVSGKIPWISKIPGLGFLFRHSTKKETKKELVFIISAKINR